MIRIPFKSLMATQVRTLLPASFGMVMATGIVSLASRQIGLNPLALLLFAIACVAYVILWIFTILRVVYHPRAIFLDLIDHLRGPGFFTKVAATGILGSEVLLMFEAERIAFALWFFAVGLWLLLTYTIFTALTVKEEKPPLETGISGAWLLAVVSTQSIAVLSALLAPHIEQPLRLDLNFLALSMWLWGGMLYIWMMSLIFYRYTFFRFSPGDLSPPYWINMGAMAISTLAGSLLIRNTSDAWFLNSIAPFLKGFTIFYWATGTWWIPMLLILGVWRHVYKRFPFRYDPLYWGAVFPIGMYAVATEAMSGALDFGFLAPLARLFSYAAIAAWTVTFLAFLRATSTRFGGAH
ncbi:MAG: tellurite resistance/C4-dicarboxylate transporter family protein [Pseudodonghicola sp.]|nr:tellurite resistance/C4-dicarboxylate transporter family protein [Pseudodonghicola sp.]